MNSFGRNARSNGASRLLPPERAIDLRPTTVHDVSPGISLIILVVLFVVCYCVTKTLRTEEHPRSITVTPRSSGGRSYPFSEIQADPRFPHVRTIRTKIRGVTKRNPDGKNRQRIIRTWCNCGDALFLEREPNNPVDENAIRVRRIVSTDIPDKPRLAEQLGYLSRDLAAELAPKMDRQGFVLMAMIREITGGEDGRSLGVNIQLEEYRPAPIAHPTTTT
jgi:hypothetical protein